jgi:hypothetical protein
MKKALAKITILVSLGLLASHLLATIVSAGGGFTG